MDLMDLGFFVGYHDSGTAMISDTGPYMRKATNPASSISLNTTYTFASHRPA
jgi:hypothetical protein